MVAKASSRVISADRLPGLDLLRAIAISWVMIYHCSLFGLVSQDTWVVRFGWMGVDLFFVLSGFLIAGQLLRPWASGGRPHYARFATRRLLRTLPAYLAVITVYFVFPAIRDRDHIQPLWRFLTFTQNFGLDTDPPKAFSHAWSLCVEQQFYLVFPVIVALVAIRPGPRSVMAAVASLLLGGMLIRGYFWLHDVAGRPFDPAAEPRFEPYMTLIYYPTWSRLDGLLAGVAAALVQTFRPRWWCALSDRSNLLLITGTAGTVGTTFFFHDQIPGFLAATFGFPLLAGSMALLVIAANDRRSVIGRYSIPGAGLLATGAYSLYLSHKIVFHAVGLVAGDLPSRTIALAMALTGAHVAGTVLYWLVERPFLKLRERVTRPSRNMVAAQDTHGFAQAKLSA